MRRISARGFITFLLVASLAGAAQAQSATATLTGVATAQDGARLPGVMLRILNEESGTAVEAVTTDTGSFRIVNLAPGRYRVDAELPGFEPLQLTGIVLSPGASLALDLRLEIATVRERVRVVGEARRDSVEAFEMRESRARDVGEALGVLPGVTMIRKGAIANDVVVRGFQGKDVTILIDGQRLDGACPSHMDPPAFHVDFSEVNRVEVSRGPFDVKNQGGLAGVVNIVTERPQRGWHGSANLTIASAATLSSSAAGSMGGERWGLLGGGAMRRADPYRDGAGTLLTSRGGYRPEQIEDLPAYDVATGWGRIAMVPREGTLLQVSYSRQAADAILYPYLQMDASFDNAQRVGARLEASKLPGGWDTLSLQAYHTSVDHWMTDERRTSAAAKPREYSMGTRARTAIVGGRVEVQRRSLTAGLEVSRRNWNTETMLAMQNYVPQAGLPDVAIDVVGGFLTYSVDPAPEWRLEAGARLDHAASSANDAIANTGLYLAYHGATNTRAADTLPGGYFRARWRGDSGLSFVAGVGHSTRLPDQQERFYALKRSGADFVGNPSLAPSRNTGIDAELRHSVRGVELGLTGYVYRVDDAIRVVDQPRVIAVPGIMNTVARSFMNADALMRGFEASVTTPIAPSLTAAADVSIVRGTTRAETGGWTDLPEIPPARLRARVRYDRPRWSLAAEGIAAARQDHVALELFETPSDSFAVFNVRGAWRFSRLTVTAAIDNVFDTLYQQHLSYQRDPFRTGVRVFEPGRTGSLDVAIRF